MRWYADNSELNGIRGAEIPDILLFGGIAVSEDVEAPLRSALEQVKAQFGDARAPVKWNFKALEKTYSDAGLKELYAKMFSTSKEWRRALIERASAFDFCVIVSCVESFSVLRDDIKDAKPMLSRFVFANGLMRFALHVRDCRPANASVVLDWPDGGDSEPFDSEYVPAYKSGKSKDGIGYISGALRELRFSDSVSYVRANHSTLMQFADLVLGATRELAECALGKKDDAFGVDMLRLLRTRLRGAPNDIFGRGINVPSGNVRLRTAVRDAIGKYLRQ